MKTAVIAVDPQIIRDENFRMFADSIKTQMSEGLFDRAVIVSVMHRDLYPGPIRWYSEAKQKLMAELLDEVQEATRTHLGYLRVIVLQAKSPRHDSIAETLNRFVKEADADTLVLLDNEHGILYESVLGSVASEMLKTAEVPVLLIKPQSGEVTLSEPESLKKNYAAREWRLRPQFT